MEAFNYLMAGLFGIHGPDNELVQALTIQDYHLNVDLISELTDKEVDELYRYSGGKSILLTNASKSHLRVWGAYCYHRLRENNPITLPKVKEILPDEFNHFRRMVYPLQYTNGPIPPSPADKYKVLKSTEAENFKKGIKRDPSVFPELKKDQAFNNWKLQTTALARSQGCADVLDPDYTPSNSEQTELFQLQQEYMYSVFIRTLQTDKGRELIRSHETDFNAQSIYASLLQFYTTNVVGQDNQTKLLKYITTSRLGDGNWNGPTHAYILHYQEQIRQYNKYAKQDQILPESLQLILLQNAVDSIPALSAVKTTQQQLHITQGTDITYNQYCQLLSTASLQLDKTTSTSGTSSRRQRNVYQHETGSTTQYDIDTPVSDLLETSTDLVEYDVFESIRVPTDRWSQLSAEGRQLWVQLSPTDRATLLGIDKPKTNNPSTPKRATQPRPPRRSINLHDISAFDYLSLMAGDDTTGDNGDTTPQDTPDTDADTPTREINQHETTTAEAATPTAPTATPSDLSRVAPADLRRMLAAQQHEAMTRSLGGTTPGTVRFANQTYRLTRDINAHETYHVANHSRDKKDSLIDGGSNGGMGGKDVRPISFNPNRFIDVTGVHDHQVTDIPCATVGGVTHSNIGPVILIFHQYAYTGKGSSIHSKGQWEYFGAIIDDKSIKLGGTQSIKLAGGVILPLDIVNGLPRLPLRPFMDSEWDSLPHIHVTMDKDWDPTVLDHHISDKEAWYDAQQTPTELPLPGFDIQGNPVSRETFQSEATYSDLQSNLPEHLGPLAEYQPPSSLLPQDLQESDTATEVSDSDPIDTQVDLVTYQQYLSSQHDFEVSLMQSLEPEDMIEFIYSDANETPDQPITGDILCFHSHTHSRLAFPTTRSQTRAQRDPNVKAPPTVLPPQDGDHTAPIPPEPGEPSPIPPAIGEPPPGEPHLIPPDPGEPASTEPKTGSTAPSARPPGRTLKPSQRDYSILRPLFGWLQEPIIQKTIENTTQLARLPQSELLKVHYKSPNPALNVPRRDEDLATDTVFSDTPAIDGGETMAQLFVGTSSHTYHAYGMHREKQFINTLQDCVIDHGAPNRLLSDNAQVENSEKVQSYLRLMLIGRWFSEAYKQFQNPMERGI